ncbi:hypothetical protein [Haloferula sp. BvORR071]|uniref:hypothetical protein n=1 Tax=Haloferula sp. BvORR071 TaxID=1396141 RepID=UPI00054DD1DD|nr:hypothetical protein [Haloferula sp. BvORR071]
MKNTATIGIAALLVGGAGGFLAGKAGSPDKPDQSQAKAESLAGKTQRSAPAASENSRAPRDVKQALSEPSQLTRMQKLMDLYNGMSADQLKEQAEKLDQLEGAERMMASFLLFGRWGEVDPQGALAYANSTPFGGFARPTILQSWASSDPVNAAKYYSEHANELRGFGGGPGGGGFGGGGDNAAGVIATEWAKLDPKAALEWAKGLEGRDKGTALNSVIGQMAAKNPTDAAAVAASLDAEDQPRAYGEIASKWGATDFASAEAWINTLPAESRDRAMAAALVSYANTDPAGAAAKWATMPAGERRDQALGDIAGPWARTDAPAAAKFVAGQDSENIGNAIRPVIASWAAADGPAALAFIQSQPQGELRDEATSTYIWRSQSDPQASIQLAESISDENTRNRSLGMSVFRWMQQDREAATAYVQSSTSLSEEAKTRLLENRGPWGGGGGGGGRGGRGGGR